MNTTVNIIMIICATIIALAAIICDHLFEKKYTDSKDYILSKKIIKIHRNYIAGFLGFAIIMLITSEFGGPCNILLEYLSFASTITSFVLSILAIFVTVQSSSDLYKQFARIEEATTTIKNLSGTIEENAPKISEAATDIKDTSNTLLNRLDEVVKQIKEKVDTSMTETNKKFSELLDLWDKGSESKEHTKQPETKFFDTLKEIFLLNSTFWGLLTIYTCTLSYKEKKPFNLSTIFIDNLDNTKGFLTATKATNLIRLTDIDKPEILCEESMFTEKEIIDAIKMRLDKKKKQFSEDKIKEGMDALLNMTNNIRKHFDLPELEKL